MNGFFCNLKCEIGGCSPTPSVLRCSVPRVAGWQMPGRPCGVVILLARVVTNRELSYE